jgi:predicted DNA-binding transcriptional regulator AlpA
MTANISHNSRAGRRLARAPQAAAYLQIALSTLWLWHAKRPNFPQATKAGPRVTLFDLDAIDVWLQAQAGGGAQGVPEPERRAAAA